MTGYPSFTGRPVDQKWEPQGVEDSGRRASVNRVVTGDVLHFSCRVLSEQAPALHWCPQPWQVHS
jgi:hypothetical protein